MVKNNKKFKFGETLNLGSILGGSESNIYRLFSILIHGGSLDSGHYYAYIKPTVTEDKWFKFNDSTVSEVTKNHALSEGMGGEYREYDINKYGHSDYPGSTGHLNLTYHENNTNAYMLVYVREADIDKVMINTQLPESLDSIFNSEREIKSQLARDR
jgi:ubiquitin carboxyl-terminal hydrolase 7